jgi:putative acetyltransferase
MSARPTDRAAIRTVVRDAFATGGRDAAYELEIIESVWTQGTASADLELVAAIDGQVVGHVLGSWGTLGEHDVIGIGPLAVLPAHQRAGVGSALMQELIRRADESALPLVVLLGDPGYYRRFGFEPSGPLNIAYSPVGPDNPHFQVRRLGAYTPKFHGQYTYSWERHPL